MLKGLFILLAVAAFALMAFEAGGGPASQGPGATCALPRLAMPPAPAKIPGYTEFDPSTGLHVTGAMRRIKIMDYRLEVAGQVDNPLSLTYDERRVCREQRLVPNWSAGLLSGYCNVGGRTARVCPAIGENQGRRNGGPIDRRRWLLGRGAAQGGPILGRLSRLRVGRQGPSGAPRLSSPRRFPRTARQSMG